MLEIKCEEKFSMGSTYSYSKEIQKTILQSLPGWIKAKCSVLKIIRSICNMVKINPLQCCLLAWLLTKSKYDIEKISTDSKTKIVEEEFDQKVLLFVLMNAYYVKQFVCQQLEPEIEQDIVKQIPNFKHVYTKKFNPEKSLKTLSLFDINKIFNEWTCKQNKKTKIDYNNLVDKILYLSKSYNVTGHDQGKQQKLGNPRKRRKLNHPSNIDQNEIKSDVESQNEQKSQSLKNFESQKQKHASYKFTHSPEPADFLGPSQDNMHSFKREEHNDMIQSKRTTRNMLQSLNICDFIPSQDNLFNSQLSSISGVYLMGSQQSQSQQHRQQNDMSSSLMKKSKDKSGKNTMKLRKTESFDGTN